MPDTPPRQRQRAYFPVARGLICTAHHKKVGSSIWVYLWILNHQTSNAGEVARNEPVTAAYIGGFLDMEAHAVRRHVARLQREGYVRVESTPGKGLRLTICKPMVVGLGTSGQPARSADKSVHSGPGAVNGSVHSLRTEVFTAEGPSQLDKVFEQKQENRSTPAPVVDNPGVNGHGEAEWRRRVTAAILEQATAPVLERLRDVNNGTGLSYAFGMSLRSIHLQEYDPAAVAEAVCRVVERADELLPTIQSRNDATLHREVHARLTGGTA